MSLTLLTPAQVVLARAMPEAELEENVRQLCLLLGTERYHTLRPKGSPAGWPDDVIGGPGGVIFRELKRQNGRASPDQIKWLNLLRSAGMDAAIWVPSDWYSGRIEREVRRVAGR